MPRDDHVELKGKVTKAMGGGWYSIELEGKGGQTRATLCGKMKKNHIHVKPGDNVKVSFSPYDMTHGIITRRERI